jgi:hypothetical protein
MTGIINNFDILSGKGLKPFLMVEKTFCFTFQPLTPTNQNYSPLGSISNFVRTTVSIVLLLRGSSLVVVAEGMIAVYFLAREPYHG